MRLNQITVGSTDLDRAERFYVLLGLRLIVKTDDYLRFECPAGDSTFSVERVERVSAGEQVTIYFETDDLDEQYRRLRGSVEFSRRRPTCRGCGARPGCSIPTATDCACFTPATHGRIRRGVCIPGIAVTPPRWAAQRATVEFDRHPRRGVDRDRTARPRGLDRRRGFLRYRCRDRPRSCRDGRLSDRRGRRRCRRHLALEHLSRYRRGHSIVLVPVLVRAEPRLVTYLRARPRAEELRRTLRRQVRPAPANTVRHQSARRGVRRGPGLVAGADRPPRAPSPPGT